MTYHVILGGVLQMQTNRKMITVFVLVLALFIFSGTTVAMNIGYAAVQATTLPSCTDPTGQNLPCMMVISTLPSSSKCAPMPGDHRSDIVMFVCYTDSK
jgi:hypothetical protein